MQKPVCSCHQAAANPAPPVSTTAKVAKALPSAFMSLLIALFPKCPICWAVYMSMFSSIGLARIPYMGWLFPVLLAFLALHLVLLARQVAKNGYLPLVLSLLGVAFIAAGRFLLPNISLMLYTGVGFITLGSVMNSFLSMKTKLSINPQ